MSLIDQLKTTLANHTASALNIWGFHWNVEGNNFKQYHDIFGEVYKSLLEQVDSIAELIRATSKTEEYAIATPEIIEQNRTQKTVFLVGNKSSEMMDASSIMLENLKSELNAIFDTATKEKEQGVANYCATQIEKLSTTIWMIAAITKDNK